MPLFFLKPKKTQTEIEGKLKKFRIARKTRKGLKGSFFNFIYYSAIYNIFSLTISQYSIY